MAVRSRCDSVRARNACAESAIQPAAARPYHIDYLPNESRFQRLAFFGDRPKPGALPQAIAEVAPLALNQILRRVPG